MSESSKECKTKITPYAFVIENSLFGLPLATPANRAMAMLIDAVIVGLLAQQDAALLLLLAAATFFKAGKTKQDAVKWRRTRKFFRVLGLMLMMLIAYHLINGIVEQYTAKAQSTVEQTQAAIQSTEPDQQNDKNDSQQSATSLTDWLKGIIEKDLGFGFGWAALYFTVFTAWWGGQTPGKRLLGIRVIRLDGKPLGLWDTFGRYGGYGAGFATGLLGFFQIYWDPNRQAIHDKISATVVIKGDLPKITSTCVSPQTE